MRLPPSEEVTEAQVNLMLISPQRATNPKITNLPQPQEDKVIHQAKHIEEEKCTLAPEEADITSIKMAIKLTSNKIT